MEFVEELLSCIENEELLLDFSMPLGWKRMLLQGGCPSSNDLEQPR
jgi:hypothetical protein